VKAPAFYGKRFEHDKSVFHDDMQFDYLPFNPEYCVYFEMGDFASLAGLHVSPGKVEPAFAPDGRALHLSLDCFWIKPRS